MFLEISNGINIIFIIIMRNIAYNKRNREYKAVPFVSAGVGYIAYFIAKDLSKVPQEYGAFIINISFYTAIVLSLYKLSNLILKWFLAIKFDINEYSNIE
ncbi:hypothetical protein KHQ81_06140 [Mycoplasmatota bacterium]|nr:hypothetical protein KHQ81_06140 [Mycoplasmatota bacterium]